MSVYNLGKNRMLCWDDFIIDKKESAEVRMHKPVKRECVFRTDEVWEGNVCGYASLLKVGEKYRLYYRAANINVTKDGQMHFNRASYCVAESSDCKSFKRLPINKYEREGVCHNNIFHDVPRDNLSVCYDENPDCPDSERFKAVGAGGLPNIDFEKDDGDYGLYLFVSPDGINFEPRGRLNIEGKFDSLNLMFWDKQTKQYYFFYRGKSYTGEIDSEGVRVPFREIWMATSKDLVNFEHHGNLNYIDEQKAIELYTNNVCKYHRASDMFIGFPTRYMDRREGIENFEQMPLPERHAFITKHHGREGTAITDCVVMTSRDGYNFNRWEEAYLTPGIEAQSNWWYGDCYPAKGLVQTPSDTEGAPDEISFVMGDNYRIKPVEFYRYTTRLDGFFSWYAKHKGGEILTKPFTFEGSELELNFSSSALGGVTVTLCDECGNELDGYKSVEIFGDSIDRKVKFEKDLAELNATPVRLKFTLRDTDLYSFRFN